MLIQLHCSDESASALIRSCLQRCGHKLVHRGHEKRIVVCLLGPQHSGGTQPTDQEMVNIKECAGLLKRTRKPTLLLTDHAGYHLPGKNYKFWEHWGCHHTGRGRLITTKPYHPTATSHQNLCATYRQFALERDINNFIQGTQP